MSVAVESCVRCTHPITRSKRPLPGTRAHQAHGLCGTCYTNTRRTDVRGTGCWTRTTDPVVDEIAVQRAAHGERLPLNAAERLAVVALLTRQGRSANEIARATGLAQRSVVRLRARAS